MKCANDPEDNLVHVSDRYGAIRSSLNFSKLTDCGALAFALKRSFVAVTGQNSVESRRQVWRCLRKFAVFLKILSYGNVLPLPMDLLIKFRTWLCEQSLNDSTRQSHFNDVRRILLWISRNENEILHKATVFEVPSFERSNAVLSTVLDRQEVQALLKACYSEIDTVAARMSEGSRLMAGQGLTSLELERQILIRQLLQEGDGRLALQSELAGKVAIRLVNRHGGLTKLWRLIAPSAEDVFPYYLAILAQCSGNPMAIRNLTRECLRMHPLREDRCALVWMKERANKEQIADFSLKRARSAPHLVKQLSSFNEILCGHASVSDRDKLFLAVCNSRPAVPCMQSMHNMLDKFISRHNLKSFDFKQLRKTGAVLHLEAANDIRSPRDRLNHGSARTTMHYVGNQHQSDENERTINRYQGLLIAESMISPMNLPENGPNRELKADYFPTVFGFGCRDPFAGVSPGTSRGELCMKFGSCATCPGAVVVLDDHKVLVKLVQSSEVLARTREKAIQQGWLERFNAIYADVQHTIDCELLPRANPRMVEFARDSDDFSIIPELE